MVIIGSVAVVLAVVFWGVWNLILKWRERGQRKIERPLPETPRETGNVTPLSSHLRQDDRPDFRRDRPAA